LAGKDSEDTKQMKNLQQHLFDPKKCRADWKDYAALLAKETILSERNDVLPFFKKRNDLCLLICTYFPKITAPDRYAHEYRIDSDFVADLIVGDGSLHRYLLVE
jgi:hypothetical protein